MTMAPTFKRIPPRKRNRRRPWLAIAGGALVVAVAAGGLARAAGIGVPFVSGPAAEPQVAAALPTTVPPPAPTLVVVAELPTPLPTPLPRPAEVPTAVPTLAQTAPAAVPTLAQTAPAAVQTLAPTVLATVAPTAPPTAPGAVAPTPLATVGPVAASAATTSAPVVAAAASDAEQDWFAIGKSVQGRDIRAIRIGSGPIHLAVMGAIHGGWEKNTMTLVQMAFDYFNDHADEIPNRLSVYFVPAINPDGIAYGTSSEAAWNAHDVDLNRNFDSYNWSQDTFGRVGGRYGPTGTRKNGGGPAPFSEPETRAVRDFVLGKHIEAVLSYHSGIVSVTAKDGGGGVGEPLAKQVAAITGYGYIGKWTEYKLTGQFMDWLDEQGVKGVEVELPDQQTLDWAKNLKSMQAVMHTLATE